MARPTSTARGREAESLAAAWLESRGWVILARNLRVGRDEIDLLGLDGATLVCVEVRARRGGAMVSAGATVTSEKRRRLRRAALAVAAAREQRDLRVDVVTVTDGTVEIFEGAVDFSDG